MAFSTARSLAHPRLVAFGAGDKERRLLLQTKQASEIQVTFVHHVERARLDRQRVEDVDFVRISRGKMDKRGNVPAQIEQRVQLDGGLAPTKRRPGKQRQTQVDRGRVERVGRLFQLDAERFLSVQRSRLSDEDLREVAVDAPVARAIGVGQRAPRNASAKAGVIQLRSQRTQAGFDVAEALAKRHLGKRHAQKLIATTQFANPAIAVITPHATVEFVTRKQLHQLSKHQLTRKHASPFDPANWAKSLHSRESISSRARPFVHPTQNRTTTCNNSGKL